MYYFASKKSFRPQFLDTSLEGAAVCGARRAGGGARRNRTRENCILPDHIMGVKCPGLTVSCSPKTKNKGPAPAMKYQFEMKRIKHNQT